MEDMTQYLDMFFEESKEHLQIINQTLLDLEEATHELELVNTIFRSAHTLKGMSATMGFERMAHLTHEMENALDLMRNGKLPVTSEVMDLLFRSVDKLESMLPAILATGSDSSIDITSCVADLKSLISGKPLESQSQAAAGNSGIENASQLNQYEYAVIQESTRQGNFAFDIHVGLTASCLLKAARAYMVMQALENHGEVIRTEPKVEDLEEENFDRSFKVILVTSHTKEEIEKAVMGISEIESCTISLIDTGTIDALEEVAAASEVIVQEMTSASVNTQSEEKPKQNQQPQAAGEKRGPAKMAGKSIRVDIERLEVLMNLFSELVINRTRLEQIASQIHNQDLDETVEQIGRVSSDLQNIVMTIRMVPVDTVFNRFPRMVRDLARDLGKKVEFVISGAETELDRTVIDEIGDPLVHMLRNSLDHALETPEERLAAGKNETGRLVLEAYHSGNNVFIEVTDDGRGIDRNVVLKKALERGLVTKDQAQTLSDEAVFDLLFHSGFSTAKTVSDLSGRGVGLDVVKSKIESLGGKVLVKSILGQGTKFIVQLPLTLTILQALLIEAGSEKYAIPLSSITETTMLKPSEVRYVQNAQVMDFRGQVIPLLFLKTLFGIGGGSQANEEEYHVVIIKKGNRAAGLVVDGFLGQQEVVLKSVGSLLAGRVFATSGATILGDGQVALIVDCNALLA